MITSLIDQPHFNKTTNFSLIIANLFPIYGVLFLGWEVFDIVIFYCIETFIIGLFNAVKMFICQKISLLFFIPFFLIHYNIFVFVQFILIVNHFAYPNTQKSNTLELDGLFQYTYDNVDYLFLGIIGIVISHGHSLYTNFYLGKEYLGKEAVDFMFKPYRRVMLQQFIAMLGASLILAFGSPLPLLIILVIAKTVADLKAHNISHHEELAN